jgi:hypothetical protein
MMKLGVWCTPAIPAFERLRQKDHELEVSLGYKESLRPVRTTE